MKTIIHKITTPGGAVIQVKCEFEASIQYAEVVYEGDIESFIREAALPYALPRIEFAGTFLNCYDNLKARGFKIETSESGDWDILEM